MSMGIVEDESGKDLGDIPLKGLLNSIKQRIFFSVSFLVKYSWDAKNYIIIS